jgi:phage FluMu protein Com
MFTYYYESMLCPRCKTPIKHINEVHKNTQLNTSCRSNKIAKGAYVYLILDNTNDFLKIGYSEDPYRRHKELVHGSTNEIRLLGFFPGSKVNEKIVQTKFKSANVKREWFCNDTAIIDYFTSHPLFINTANLI